MDIVYHGSQTLFDSFSLEMGGSFDRASNGALGVWVTPIKSIATAFCQTGYLYELGAPEGAIKTVPLSWLIDRHDEAHDLENTQGRQAAIDMYASIRKTLLDEGYTQLWIIEENGEAYTRVFLTTDFPILTVSPYTQQAA